MTFFYIIFACDNYNIINFIIFFKCRNCIIKHFTSQYFKKNLIFIGTHSCAFASCNYNRCYFHNISFQNKSRAIKHSSALLITYQTNASTVSFKMLSMSLTSATSDRTSSLTTICFALVRVFLSLVERPFIFSRYISSFNTKST